MAGDRVSGGQEIEDMIATPGRRVVAVVMGAMLSTGVARAVDPEITKLAGYVDGSSFAELSDPEGSRVEISLPGKILKPFCGALTKQDPDLEVACDLEWIGAVILEFEEGTPNREKVRALVEKTENRLQAKGWERLAFVQEKDELIRVLMLVSGEKVQGLVVFVVGADEIVFANVAGDIDMNRLGALADKMDIPGLEEIPD